MAILLVVLTLLRADPVKTGKIPVLSTSLDPEHCSPWLGLEGGYPADWCLLP